MPVQNCSRSFSLFPWITSFHISDPSILSTKFLCFYHPCYYPNSISRCFWNSGEVLLSSINNFNIFVSRTMDALKFILYHIVILHYRIFYQVFSWGLYIAKPSADSCIMSLTIDLMDSWYLLLKQLHIFIKDLGCKKEVGPLKVHTKALPYNKSQQDKYDQLWIINIFTAWSFQVTYIKDFHKKNKQAILNACLA